MKVNIFEGAGNHGCCDSITVTFPNGQSTVGIITDVDACSSCWQVGHDIQHADYMDSRIGSYVWFDMTAKEVDALLKSIKDDNYERGNGSALFAEDQVVLDSHHWREFSSLKELANARKL